MSTYTIRAGDTLSAIAASHHTTLADILSANPGIAPEKLQIGQVIHLHPTPSGGPRPGGGIPGSEGGSRGGGG